MTITEGLKELALIKKKVRNNVKFIQSNSAIRSNELSAFGSREAQEKEVASRVQANRDLMKQYVKIKSQIDRTNQDTKVIIEGVEDTIANHLTNYRNCCQMFRNTLEALETGKNLCDRSMHGMDPSVTVVPLYDEAYRQQELLNLENYEGRIMARLELVNATTELIP